MGKAWAPEATWVDDYYGEGQGAFVVYWSAGLYADDDYAYTKGGAGVIHWGVTRDFTQSTYEYGGVFVKKDYTVIDATILQDNGKTYRVVKKESERKCFMESTTAKRWWEPEAEWTMVCTDVTNGVFEGEGPAAYPDHQKENGWYLLVDDFTHYRALSSDHLDEGWTVTDEKDFHTRSRMRHGGVLSLTKAQYDAIRQADASSAVSEDLGNIQVTMNVDKSSVEAALPETAEVNLRYNRGTAQLPVEWDLSRVKMEVPGTYQVSGLVQSIGVNGNNWVGDGGSTAWYAKNKKLYSTTAITVKASVEVKDADATRLQNAIEAKVDGEDTYMPSSWKPYADALAKAKETLADAVSLTQDELDQAAETLEKATEALTKLTDKETLRAVVEDAKRIPAADQEKYTKNSWKAYTDALSEAEVVLADKDAAPEQVKAAEDSLEKAVESLFRLADKTALQAAVDEAEEIPVTDEAKYLPSGWKVFQAELGKAREMLADEEVTQAEVTAAVYSLMKAQEKLVRLADKTDLQAAVDEAKKVPDTDKENYTAESWKAFRDALVDAEEVLAEENPSQEEVSIAAHDLVRTRIGLTKAPEPTEPSEPTYPEELAGPVREMFVDVRAGDWFEADVQYVYDRGIMTGLDKTYFGPNHILSRAQFALILWRMEGKPKADSRAKRFTDVPETGECYFRDAVKWASGEGIITGYEDGSRAGMFGPSDAVTREQLATMLYRYADYKKYDVTAAADLGKYSDGANVSGYAEKAMSWAVGTGILKGNGQDQTLAPKDEAERAQAAAMIRRFLEMPEN